MPKNPPDERLVYLALKNVFKGPDAQLRNLKKIRKQIQKHQDNEDVRALVDEHNMVNICNTARLLLERDIFTSTLKAKIRFPEVFDVSPAQSAERVASEAEAAKGEADAIRDIAEGRQGAGAPVLVDQLDMAQKGKAKQLGTWSNTFGFSANIYRDSNFGRSASEAFLSCSIIIGLVPVSTVVT